MLPVPEDSRFVSPVTVADTVSILVDRMVVVGVGLIGGSFARAVREAGVVKTITGFDSSTEHLLRAQQLGIIDEIATDPATAVRNAQMVFVSVPVCSISGVVKAIAPFLEPGCVVTDGGSVKAPIVEECGQLLPEHCSFVGGHPIAGTENSGPESSFSALFRGKRSVLTPTAGTNQEALRLVAALWEAVGAQVCIMEPHHHDRIFAEISHLPHVVAYALVHAVGHADVEGENVLSYSAGGFRDFTRIASSDPRMWRDIAIMNRDALLVSIDSFTSSLSDLRQYIVSGDGDGLSTFFTVAKEFRDTIE